MAESYTTGWNQSGRSTGETYPVPYTVELSGVNSYLTRKEYGDRLKSMSADEDAADQYDGVAFTNPRDEYRLKASGYKK